MLSNLKISYRLSVGFGIALLGLTVISFVGLNSLSLFNKEVDLMVHDRFPKTVWANEIVDQININAQVLRNIVLTDDKSEIETEMQRVPKATEIVAARLDSLERTTNSDRGKALLNSINDKRKEFIEDRTRYLNYVSTGQKEAAIEMFFGELRTSQDEYMDAVYGIMEYQNELVHESALSLDETYSSSVTMVYSIGAIIFLLVIGASVLITKSITSPVNEVKERMAQLESVCLTNLGNGLNLLSKGDLSAKVEKATKHLNYTQKDEVGEMARVFDSMLTKAQGGIDAYEITRSKINQLSDELGRLIEDSKNGLLDNRGDDQKFEGVFRKLIAGLNQTLDAVILPVQEGSRVLEVMSTGDFTPRINADYKGQHAVIKNSINKLGESVTRILKDVTDAVAATASAGTQISSSSEELAAGSEEQSAQTTEIAGAIEQMTTTILQTTRNASTAAEQAKKAGDAAVDGGSVIKETIQGMNRIAEVVKNAALTVKELGASSEQIGTIVQVIDDIADQTNLLALNAAIEAARAGEQGRGFAVVADEVRKLAERTTKATKEIGEMIKKIQKETGGAVASMELGTQEVEKGITLAEKSGKSLNEIITNASSVVDVINQVAAASEEQSSAAEQISKSIEGISSVTEQSTAGVQQIAKAAADLNSLTINLQNLVEQFKIEEDSFGRSRLAVRSNGVLVKH